MGTLCLTVGGEGEPILKKAVAVLASMLCYIGAFLLLFRLSMGQAWLVFFFGTPLFAAAYFIPAGAFFARRLHLNRWILWLCMNGIGGLCGWVIVLIQYPILLMNGFILLLLLPALVCAALVWAVVGLGFLCWNRRAARAASAPEPVSRTAAPAQPSGTWVKKLKWFAGTGGVVLLILAAAGLYGGVRNLNTIRPADQYEDSGIHTFAPYDILPISVKTTGPRRYRRLHPTKIVYMVYYRTTNGSGYQWRDEGGTARVLAEQLYQRGSVERRVLSIPSEDTYITVEPHLTAQQYTDGLRRRQYILLGLSGGYVLCYGVAWIVTRRKEAEED